MTRIGPAIAISPCHAKAPRKDGSLWPFKVAFLAIAVLLVPAFLCSPSAQVVDDSGGTVVTGAVVENIAHASSAEKAGLQAGDILLAWSRGDYKGEIRSPFDVAETQTEQAPLGTIRLQGLRGIEGKVWSLSSSDWGLTTRPNFSGDSLALYRAGQDFAKTNTAAARVEAAGRWKELADRHTGSRTRWLAAWLFLHAAELMRDGRQWKEADEFYQAAIQSSAKAEPVIAGILLQSWARAYDRRSDWAYAEKYFRQSIEKSETSGSGQLAIAFSLDGLGSISRHRGDLAKAEQYYQRSLEIRAKRAPGSLDVAASLNGLGLVAFERGELAKAQQYHRQALDICEKLAPGGLDLADTLADLGIVATQSGELAKAEQYHRQALEIRERLEPENLDVAASLYNLGSVAYEGGDLAKAEVYYRRALEMREKLAPGSLAVAASLHNLGIVADQGGDLAGAERYHRQSLEIYAKLAPDSLMISRTLHELGIVADERGNLADAERYYRQSSETAEKLAPGGLSVAADLDELAQVLWQRGDLEAAEKQARKSLKIHQNLLPGSPALALILTTLGDIDAARGKLAAAENYYHQALQIQQKLAPDGPDLAATFSSLGRLAAVRGDRLKADTYYHQALAIQEKLAPEGIAMAEVLQRLADSAHKFRDLQNAEQYSRQALAIREKLAPGSADHAESLAAVASVLRERQQLDLAAEFYQKAVTALETQTAHLGGTEEVRSGFRSRYLDYYSDYIDLLMQQKHPELAFQVLERSRARSLLETLHTSQINIHAGGDSVLLERERSLKELIRGKSNRRLQVLAGNREQGQEAQVAALSKELETLLAELKGVESEIRASSPAYGGLTQPPILTLREVQQQVLDSDTVLLEFGLAEKRSYLWAIGQDSLTTHELPRRDIVEKLARNVYQYLTARRNRRNETGLERASRLRKADAEYRQSAARLSRMILLPVANKIEGKRLLIVADGALEYVPFDALPEPIPAGTQVPLMVKHEIISSPSASVMALLRKETDGRARSNEVLVLADPVFSKDDGRVQAAYRVDRAEQVRPELEARVRSAVTDLGLGSLSRLFSSREEAKAIQKEAQPGQSKIFLDFKASLDVLHNLGQYRVLHFATHSLLNSQHPELSGLVFSLVDKRGRPQAGFLDLQGIYNLDLPVDLVVLSACETGLGKQIRGEGLVGLTRGFMYAGARQIMASLWSVDDAATAELMKHFYRAMLRGGQSPAAALRQAQMAMWKQRGTDWSQPYYWAAFTIQGDGKAVQLSSIQSR